MSELIKRLITAMTLCLTALLVHAQEWTKEDSLRLRKPAFAQFLLKRRNALSNDSFSLTVTLDIVSHLTSLQL